MYERFFGLVDAPFRLTPDPRYLFLSAKHADALAHLRLGLSESSGFVCITGDVGTGKTTVLRHFLAELGPEVSAAYVVNPTLSPLELLQTINAEFGLPADWTSKKALIDQLNRHLLAQRHAGRMSVVVVDEAQALSVEVLEHLRLLSNLETTTEKLLRVILVGQPQLRALLIHPDLIQLNQRITLRWHIGPLERDETAAYVRHRITVASGGQQSNLFTAPALRYIHKHSGGVPRLVNMLAHRGMLAAFASEQRTVTRGAVRRAHGEISTVPLPLPMRTARRPAWLAPAVAAGVAVVATLGALRFGPELWRTRERVALADAPTPERVHAVAPVVDAAAPAATTGFPAILENGVPPAEPAPSAAATPPGSQHADTVPPPGAPTAAADPATAPLAAANQPTADPTPDPATAPPATADHAAAPLAAAEQPTAEPTRAPAQPAATPEATPAAEQAVAAAEPTPPAADAAPPAPEQVAALGATAPDGSVAPAAPTPSKPDAPAPDATGQIQERLLALDSATSARTALGVVLRAWQLAVTNESEVKTVDDFPRAAERRGLEHLSLAGNTPMLRLLDVPAVLELRVPGADGPRYATLVGLRDGLPMLDTGDGTPVTLPAAFLESSWYGQAHVFWRDFEGLGPGVIGRETRGQRVARLQTLLGRAGAYHGAETGVFDVATMAAVQEFQRSRYVAVDGIVGRLTRVVLYAAAGGYPRPTLVTGDRS